MDQKQIALPVVSVVVPTWNAAPFVERVLSALIKQQGVSMEILIVDNGVTNNSTQLVTESYAKQFPFIKYLGFEKQLGYAGAVNAGVKQASYPIIAVSNNDNLPAEDWLKELLRLFEKKLWNGKPIGIVSSFVPRPGPYAYHRTDYNFWGRVLYHETQKVPQEDFSVFHPDGSAFLFNREVFNLPYRDEYFIYHEDSSLGWRARLMGYEVVLARNSQAETFDGGSTRRIPYHTAFYSERNRWLNALCFPQWTTILKLSPLWLVDLVLSFLFGQRKRARIHAWIWLVSHPRFLCNYRASLQSERKVPDTEILGGITARYLEVHGDGAKNTIKRFINGLFAAYLRVVGIPFRN